MFRKVSGARKYFKYGECNPGDKLVVNGTFTGSEEGKFGTQHIFHQADGETVVLNSSGHLNWLLENHVDFGQKVNINYAERKKLTKGPFAGKDAHTFELEVDDQPLTPEAVTKAVEMAAGTTDGDITL